MPGKFIAPRRQARKEKSFFISGIMAKKCWYFYLGPFAPLRETRFSDFFFI
jgi:hypothetical protein